MEEPAEDSVNAAVALSLGGACSCTISVANFGLNIDANDVPIQLFESSFISCTDYTDAYHL